MLAGRMAREEEGDSPGQNRSSRLQIDTHNGSTRQGTWWGMLEGQLGWVWEGGKDSPGFDGASKALIG